MRIVTGLSIMILIGLVVSCTPPAVVGVMPVEIDVQLKNLKPPRDQALIYIVRPEQILGDQKIQITCDGEFIGYTKGGMYLAFLVDPGLHILTTEDSIRIVDDFDVYYQKRKSNKISILSTLNDRKEDEKQNKDHLIFIKKHNYAMQCYRSQKCIPEELNHILKSEPFPMEMYHAIVTQGGQTLFLMQTFKPAWNHPMYLLTDCEQDRGRSLLPDLKHSRYVNPDTFPRNYINLTRK
ncbi:hypothetical protein JW948_10720 [bacterium]|nr:hypothetical protein [bacterium]